MKAKALSACGLIIVVAAAVVAVILWVRNGEPVALSSMWFLLGVMAAGIVLMCRGSVVAAQEAQRHLGSACGCYLRTDSDGRISGAGVITDLPADWGIAGAAHEYLAGRIGDIEFIASLECAVKKAERRRAYFQIRHTLGIPRHPNFRKG